MGEILRAYVEDVMRIRASARFEERATAPSVKARAEKPLEARVELKEGNAVPKPSSAPEVSKAGTLA